MSQVETQLKSGYCLTAITIVIITAIGLII